jgi:zeaxanthin glucosyltransferase
VFITHGGANSVMEATTLGVPMLVAPLCNDQFHNAAFVSRAGTGTTLDLASATAPEVRAVLVRLLGDPGIRARAAQVAASYRDQDGSTRVADELTRWLT